MLKIPVLSGLRHAQKVRPRTDWERSLTWFRLRYTNSDGPTKAVNLLSRAQIPGRVVLYYRPGDVAEINIGVPGEAERLLLQMAADYSFLLKPAEVELPGNPMPMAQAAVLPFDREFVAHIVNEYLFVTPAEGEKATPASRGYFPQPPSKEPGRGGAVWRFPDDPPPGITSTPVWNHWPTPERLIADHNDPEIWILGRSLRGPLHVSGNLNLYGQPEATSSWLVGLLVQAFAANPNRIAVIDGDGLLAGQLKRKSAVTRLFPHGLAFIDMDGASARGMNPLAPVEGESQEKTVGRWQTWFTTMEAHTNALTLLPQAYQEGVRDLFGLRRWLIGKRQEHFAAVSALSVLVEQIIHSAELGEWIKQPADTINDLSRDGSLIFSVNAHNWERQQLLWAVLLAVLQIPGLRLVVHGFPAWDQFDTGMLNGHHRIILTNGPTLDGSTTVLVGCRPKNVPILAERFLGNHPVLTENLRLLRPGDGIIVNSGDIAFATWNKR